MREKTKYRKVCDGWKNFLEYAVKHKFLFWTWETWERVPKPYYNWIHRRDTLEDNLSINSYDDNLEQFVKQWPFIEDYLIDCQLRQNELVKKAIQKRKEHNEKVNKVEYL